MRTFQVIVGKITTGIFWCCLTFVAISPGISEEVGLGQKNGRLDSCSVLDRHQIRVIGVEVSNEALAQGRAILEFLPPGSTSVEQDVFEVGQRVPGIGILTQVHATQIRLSLGEPPTFCQVYFSGGKKANSHRSRTEPPFEIAILDKNNSELGVSFDSYQRGTQSVAAFWGHSSCRQQSKAGIIEGLYCDIVDPKSFLGRLGGQPGDLIRGMNSARIQQPEDIVTAAQVIDLGRSVLFIERNGARFGIRMNIFLKGNSQTSKKKEPLISSPK